MLKAKPKDPKSGLRDLTGGETLAYEGTSTHSRKSHMNYALNKDGEPTGELTLGNMGGAYWSGNQKVSNSDVDLGDNLSIAGSYSWDTEAGSVTVAGKKDKIFKARLFVEPYAMTYYKHVYLEQGRNPGNTAKAINVIFVPQTNHKTSDLQKSIGEHKTENVEGKDVPTQSKYYNASADKKDAYEKALKTATDLLATVKDKQEKDLTEEQKAQIDNATINLNKARAELDGADTNKDKLNDSIDANGKAAEGTTAATGTQATNQFKNVSDPDFKKADGSDDKDRNEAAKKAKTDYDKALEEANKVKEDKNATQKAVDDAKAKLDAAREKLNDFTTNKDELNNAIAKDGKVNTGRDNQGNQTLTNADPTYQKSTPEQRKAYDDAVKKADEVFKDPNASQKEVNKAIDDLKKAKAALDANATDKAPLAAAVQKSLDKDPNKHSVFYTNAKNKTGDTAAQQAVKNYDDALAKAKQVLADDKATKKDVEDAKKALEDAEKVLYAETYQTKATDLAEAIADNFSGYLMPAYFNAFDKAQAEGKDSQAAKDFKAYNDAYHAAKDLMDELNKPGSTVDQKKVDAVKEQLIAARKIIDTYATDTSRLSAAALNDFAIQHSPAYANLKELAEKQNPSEEEKAKVEAAKKAKEAYEKAAAKLTAALTNTLPKDQANGHDIPDNIIPKEDGDPNDKDYLKDIQAHKNGEPLNRDVDTILKEMNEAAKALDKFATKTDELIKSINEDATTHPSPAFKNASQPSFQKPDGSGPDDAKNAAAKAAADAYGKALNEAKDLLKKPDATQKEINDAKAALDKARAELDKYNTDVAKLKASVKKHGTKADVPAPEEGTLTSDAYRNASDPHFMKEQDGKLVPDDDKNNKAAADKKAYDEALTKAQELLKKHDDKDTPLDAQPTQQEVDEAKKALKEIKDKILANYKTNPVELQKEVDKSKDGDDDQRDTTFENTPEFKNADAKGDEASKKDLGDYNKKLQAAKALLDKFDRTTGKPKTLPAGEKAPTQKQLDDALDALKAAKKKITDDYKTDPSKLKSEADKDGDFTKTPEYVNAQAKGDDASKKDLEAYKKALEDANKVLGDKNATQKQVDDALKKLQDAKSKLTDGYKTDKNKLYQETGNDPEFRKSIPFLIADSKDIAEYNKALNDANAVLNNPNATQAQVDEALRKLQRIKQKMIDLYNSLGSGSDDDSDGGSTGANNANANAVDKSMLHAEVNGALADVANGAGAAGAANGAKGSKGALVDASVIKEFNDALENARRVLADPNATQEQVEAATMRLRAARAALNAAKANKGSNLRGNMGVQTGVDSATLSAFAAVFVGLAGLGVSAKRRKHAR